MNKKYKRYLKLNIMSLFFTGISFISITLAWFAYSGLATVETTINVKAWQIQFTKNEQVQSNNIVVSLNDISPGMQVKSEVIDINNLGDDDALIDYEIKSARVFDEVITINNEQDKIEDILSHDYPFHINMSLSDHHANAHDGIGEFTISVSWPLDSGNDELDSIWGQRAYEFNQQEQLMASQDPSYQPRPSINIEISLKAEQYISDASAPDPEFKLGTIVLFDYTNNQKCTAISDTCIKSYVIDVNNKLGDTKLTLLPDLYNNYLTSTATSYSSQLSNQTANWKTTNRGLKVEDILPIISKDVTYTTLMRPPISNEIVGNLSYGTRLNDYITSTINQNGFYRFLNEKFPYLVSTKCYWLDTNYNDSYKFALTKVDNEYSKVYNESKETTCSVIPVAIVDKIKLKV